MTDVQDHDDPASIQVLTNADLLHCIFTFVPLLPKSHLDSYMARCAIVYRAFYEPAIRILWRDLNIGLLPLWHLLSPPNTPFPSPNGGNNEPLLNYFQVVSGFLGLSEGARCLISLTCFPDQLRAVIP